MAFLKRLSGNLWSYVSPNKENLKEVSQTAPDSKKPALPTKDNQVNDILKRNSSMSPEERVNNWNIDSTSSRADSPLETRTSNKRTRLSTTSTGHRRKILKMEDNDMEYTPEYEYNSDSDVIMEDDEREIQDDSDIGDNINVGRSASRSCSPHQHNRGYDTTELDSSIVVSETDYQDPGAKRKLVSPTEEHFSRGITREELRAQGWDDDHITLVQKIAMRGREPLMPLHWKFEYRFNMPEVLFAADGEDAKAVIGSVKGDHFRGMHALEKLFEMGGKVRDRVYLKGRVKPEQQVRRTLKEYIKWAQEDSGLDCGTAIPLLAIETKPVHVDPDTLKQNAKRKLANLAARYREAFRVLQSIESSPASRTSTQLSYPVPTLYAIVASNTLIALAAYNPDDAVPDVKPIAMFEMKHRDYDVWNALALAMVVCHLRNVQMRIAQETGLGLETAGDARGGRKWKSYDPDL